MRVVAVMLLNHYLTEEYIDRVLEVLGALDVGEYYASMAVAWAFASAWGKFPDRTRAYLAGHDIDRVTYRKTLQKCLESYRVSQEDKAWARRERERLKKTNIVSPGAL